ncbi:hypothetical protein EU546_08600, partial [Candidatus Thorarchaeota archaeon]
MTGRRILIAIICGLILTSTSLVLGIDSATPEKLDLDGVSIAVYVGGESSASSREALRQMFLWMNATVTVMSASSIKTGALDDYDILVVPGGNAGDYNNDLGHAGREEIGIFVEDGGAFFGVCAGAYFACDWIIWEERSIEYHLNLFNGCGIGAIDDI